MHYDQAYSFLIDKLERELSPDLTYHNAQHTISVLHATQVLCEHENLDQYHTKILITAALFHDAGFSQYIRAAERQKHLPELFQPRNLLIASEKPFRKISKRFFDTTVSLSTVPSSVLEIH